MNTLYEIGFKSGDRITIALTDPQKFLDGIQQTIKATSQEASSSWYGEPGSLFQVLAIQYVLPKGALQDSRRFEHSELRAARARMESARKDMAEAARKAHWVAFDVANDAFDKAVGEFDAAFDKLITA